MPSSLPPWLFGLTKGYLLVKRMLHSEASRESGSRSALEYLVLHPINQEHLDQPEHKTVWNALLCERSYLYTAADNTDDRDLFVSSKQLQKSVQLRFREGTG